VAFFVLTFGFSWAIWLPKVLAARGLSTGLEGLPEVGAFGPTIAAVVLVYLHGGSRGVKRLLGRVLDAGFGWRWYLAALLLFPAITLFALAVAMTVGETPTFPWTGQAVVLPIAFVYVLLLGGPLQEEFGWRGYALEPLQERLGALGAGTLLGVIWGLWHLPWFYMPSMTIYYQRPFIGFLVSITLLSVAMTWIYDGTGGSLLAMVLVHASFNWSHAMFPALETETGGTVFLLAMVVLVAAIVRRHGVRRFDRGDRDVEAHRTAELDA
jgi:uncharacterized protein